MKKILLNIFIYMCLFTLIVPLWGEDKDTTKKKENRSNLIVGQKLIVIKPKIKDVLAIPLGPLKASCKVYFIGEGFGKKKGRILMLGNFPFRVSELEQVKWVSDKKVNGVVPQKFAGLTAQEVKLVVVTSLKVRSNPWKARFVGFEIKFPLPLP